MGSHIQASRFLDSAVLSLVAMFISAAFLSMFSEFYILSIESKLFNNKLALILTRLFHFKKTFDYNLTHILLLTLCIILLSLKPDYELYSVTNLKKNRQKPSENKKNSDYTSATASLSQESEDFDEKNKMKGKNKGKVSSKSK